MDLFDTDPGRLPRSKDDGDGDWWDRLIAGSPLWSADGALAREYVPIVDSDARNHASRFGAPASSPFIRAFTTRAGTAAVDDPVSDEVAKGQSLEDSSDGATVPGPEAGCPPAADHTGDAGRGTLGPDSVGPDAPSADAGDVDGGASEGAFSGASSGASGGACDAGSSSWVAVAAVGEAARVVALVPVPEDAGVCLAEAEELLAVRDRITSALAARVGRVHRAGEAKSHGHASTKLWLRSAGGMTPAGAGRLVTMSMELHRLPQVRRLFAEGSLPEGIVEAICTATSGLTDDQATTAERILLELANSAGAAEVAKAGRYLRAVLDPDGHEKDEQADFDRRFFRVRRRRGGGLEGEFYLPVEAAARLQHLLDVYARPKAEGDDRPLSVRNADALIAFLENKIATELLVLVNAESLPDDPPSGTGCDEGEPIIDDGEPTIEEPAGEEPHAEPDEEPHAEPGGAEPGARPSAVSPERTSTSPERTATVPPAGGDRSAGEDGCPTVAPSAGDDTSRAASPAAPSAACRAASSAASPAAAGAGAGAGAGGGAGGGADGQEPVTGRAAAGSSPMDGPAAAPHFDPTDSHERSHERGNERGNERGDLRDCDDVQQDHADDSDDDPGTQEEGIERGHRRNRARPQQAPPQQARPQQTHTPDPPPEPDTPPDTEGSACPGDDAWPGDGAWPGGGAWAGVGADAPPGAEHGGGARLGGDAWPGGGAWPGGDAWAGVGADAPPGSSPPGAGGNVPPGVWMRRLPGLILATGHLLPVVSVHRLARTSSLVRIVMNAAGQVLDMGRKVRLATPAQRRAVFARYATCWVDGCPLPATLCQVDHAENWCSGGLTDLKLLGPACQFHNRDRYRHPSRYTRRTIGDDRWAFTYRNPRSARRSPGVT
ncbi:DUF222 domain-containing protein [Microbispora sp. NBC_01389]|uniref:HNH endonuclease signature motif containing protein n=1 Tax=Microbispora sp. NBC_01389 TaxID=2903584 RepID=UPI0032464B83